MATLCNCRGYDCHPLPSGRIARLISDSMLLSPAEHEDLIRRVERLVRRRGIERSEIVGMVDRVSRKLAAVSSQGDTATQTVLVMAESMPDLASRLRGALEARVDLAGASVATEGRHTVLAAHVRRSDVADIALAAGSIGARCQVTDGANE